MEKNIRNARIYIDEDDFDFISHIKEQTGITLQAFISRSIKNEIQNIRAKGAVDQMLYMNREDKNQIIKEAKDKIKNQKLC